MRDMVCVKIEANYTGRDATQTYLYLYRNSRQPHYMSFEKYVRLVSVNWTIPSKARFTPSKHNYSE